MTKLEQIRNDLIKVLNTEISFAEGTKLHLWHNKKLAAAYDNISEAVDLINEILKEAK